MFNQNKQFSSKLFIAILLTFGVSLSLQNLLAAWQEPTQIPPLGNVLPPIYNEHSTPETSALIAMPLGVQGNLTISGGGNIILSGNWLSGDGGDEGIFVSNSGRVGIGTSSPQAGLHIKEEYSSFPWGSWHNMIQLEDPEHAAITYLESDTNSGWLQGFHGGSVNSLYWAYITDWTGGTADYEMILTSAGGLTIDGAMTASSFSGSGANLTSLNADRLTSGTVPAARIDNSEFFINSEGTSGQVWTSDGSGRGRWQNNGLSCTRPTCTASGNDTCTTTACPSGYVLTGGGIRTTGDQELYWFQSYPNGNSWTCGMDDYESTCYAICCTL